MSQPLRRSQRTAKGPAAPKLRVYDPRLSALLDALPDPTAEQEQQVDLDGWLHVRSTLIAPGGNLSPLYLVTKRLMDVVGSLALLTVLGPIMFAVWAVLMATTRGKPIFRQTRVGHCGKRIEILKFRTMQLNADVVKQAVANEQSGPVFKNRRDPRVTRIGYWLRKFSLDETPQIFNVLWGDMALVGPRPPLVSEVVQYEPWQFARLSVKPGLTCLWQVSGRSEIAFRDWVQLDLWYVRNQGLWTDVKLLVRTPWSVLSCRGAY